MPLGSRVILDRDNMVLLFRGRVRLLGSGRQPGLYYDRRCNRQKVHRKFRISLERHARSDEQDGHYYI